MATWLIGVLDIQYSNEIKLGFVNNFPGDATSWQKQGDPSDTSVDESGVALHSPSSVKSSTYRVFPLPPKASRLENTVRVRGIVEVMKQPDPLPVENEAAYMIWFLDANDKSFEYITVQSLGGHKKQYRAERIVEIPTEAHTFALAMVSRDSNGHFLLSDATTSLVTLTDPYRILRPLVFASWGLCLLIIGEWLFRQSDAILTLSLTGLMGATLIGVLLPLSITTGVIEPAYDKLLNMLQFSNKESLAALYKLGHFFFFFAIALLLFLRRSAIGLSTTATFQFLIIFVLATEGLQLHLFNRTTKFTDMLLDLFGILTAWIIAYIWLSMVARKPPVQPPTTKTPDDTTLNH